MTADITKYLDLITSEHHDKPNFTAVLTALIQPLADNQELLASMQTIFDIDTAVGEQLDFVGQWIGASRDIKVEITGVFFSWDTVGVGWDEGVWFGPGDTNYGISVLSDDYYRQLLKARIAANHWDGTIPGALAAWSDFFSAFGYSLKITDNQNMTMAMTVLAITEPPPLFMSLLQYGYLDIRPAGVGVSSYSWSTP